MCLCAVLRTRPVSSPFLKQGLTKFLCELKLEVLLLQLLRVLEVVVFCWKANQSLCLHVYLESQILKAYANNGTLFMRTFDGTASLLGYMCYQVHHHWFMLFFKWVTVIPFLNY